MTGLGDETGNCMQGLLLECSPLDFESLKDFGEAALQPQSPPPLWLALDEVTDPVSCDSESLYSACCAEC